MIRAGKLVAAVLGLTLMAGAVAPQALAQGSGPAAAPASDKLAGVWEGNYTTDGPAGAMTLTVTKGTPWKVAVGLGGDAPPPGEPREVAAAGNVLTWKQVFGEFDVAFKATLSDDGAQLAGTLEATQGGAYVGGGSFTLTRKK
jgi:hypothetical protein